MSSLDAEELFHLALKASESGDHEKAILHLKDSLEKKPAATTQYILAAEYAEIGMYPRAIEGMKKAVEADPTLWTAYLQMGMLHLVLNDAEGARISLEPLVNKKDLGPLHLFAAGIDAMLRGDKEKAGELLREGIETNVVNPALNRDMERILVNLSSADASRAVEPEPLSEESNRFFLSTYNKKI